MGGEDCEYDPTFRLYLQTRLSNPHYRPEVFATCTLINFIVTERSVSLRLLSLFRYLLLIESQLFCYLRPVSASLRVTRGLGHSLRRFIFYY